MDHYDFESTITDADFDFTLDDILNEFHSGGPSSAMDETQQDAVSDIHAVISQQNNNPIYGSGIEGASTINTNEFEDSVMNGSDLTTPDVSGAPETEAYEGSNPYDYQSVYSFVSRDDPDLDQIISELNGSAPASDESDHEEPADEESYPAEDYASEEDETEPAPHEEYEEERRFMSFQEGWENLKDSIRISAGGVPTGFAAILRRRFRSSEEEYEAQEASEQTDENQEYEESAEASGDYYASLFEGSEDDLDDEEEELEPTMAYPIIKEPVDSSPAPEMTEEATEQEEDAEESFTPDIHSVEEAEEAYASDVAPEDEFEEDPEDAGSMFAYYWHKIRNFFVAFFGTIIAVFQGKFQGSEDSSKKPSRFVQFLATLSLKIQQHQTNAKSAPARDAEELGPELTADKASRYYGSQIKFTKLRLRIAAVLCLILAYISFGLPVLGRLHNSVVLTSACLALEISVVMCCLDIFTAGIMDLIRKRPNANTLISLSCILSAVDAIVISMSGKTGLGLPYCGISAIAITCALWGSLLYCRGNRITLRTLALSKEPYAITAETDIGGYPDITLLKTKTSTESFVRRTEEMALDDEAFTFLAPWLIGAGLILTLLATAISKNWRGFMHIWSAIMVPTAPFIALLSYPLPFLYTARSLFHNGNAIAGWSGLVDIGESKHIIVTDHDVFPKNTISIDSIRILEGVDPQKIITYTGSVIIASGSALSPAFSELMNKNSCVIEQVYDFKCHEGGGLTAMISGDEVLVGNSGFMHLMGIHIPQKLASKSSVFVAVNGVISAIYAIKYTPVVSVQKALITLLRSKRTSIFAIKDFNITPEMIRKKFRMPSDRFDFPSFADRYAIAGAKRGKDSKIAAVVARSGLASMVQLQDEGHRLYNTVRLSVLLSLLCVGIGMIMVFLMCLSSAMESISASTLLLYMLIWLVIELLIVILQNR